MEIKNQLDPTVQTLFFSATYTDAIITFSKALMKKASVIKLRTNTDLLLSNIFQVIIFCEVQVFMKCRFILSRHNISYLLSLRILYF